jgi:hypothetical protein
MRRAHLVIFARRPAFGVGKRRLAAGIGELGALRFQRLALAQLLRRLGGDRRWRTWLAVSPDRPSAWMTAAAAVPQGGGDLGERLIRVFGGLPPGPAVVIGADAPQVRGCDIAVAFRKLGSNDAVFGPAADGGFWLLGLGRRELIKRTVRDVRWSSANALADTLANLRGRRVGILRCLEDVDDGASYARVLSAERRCLTFVPFPILAPVEAQCSRPALADCGDGAIAAPGR